MESAINLTEEDYNRMADIISNEIRCVRRADTNQCDRDCGKCDLVRPTQDIISVYDDVLEILNTLKGQKV